MSLLCWYVFLFTHPLILQSGVPASHWNMAVMPNLRDMNFDDIQSLVREKSETSGGGGSGSAARKLPSFVPYNLLTQHSIPDKSIADCVEALIGAYLIASGPRGALSFMRWLGLDLLPPEGEAPLAPPSPLFSQVTQPHLEDRACPQRLPTEVQLNALLNGYEGFEELIGYK